MKKFLCLLTLIAFFGSNITQATANSCSAYWGVESEGLTVFFENYSWSAVDVVEYTWDFGDGNMSSEENPTHTFATEGSYEVCLVVNTANNCTDEDCYMLYVADYGLDSDWIGDSDWQDWGTWDDWSDWQDCYAYFDFEADGLSVGFYNFSETSETDVTYTWDFGDGNSSSDFETTNIYAEEGEYEVCLSIEDASDCTDTDCYTIYVYESDDIDDDWTWGDYCYAFGDAYADGLSVEFEDYSWASNVVSWSWSFGDGETSNEQNPTHIYAESGDYVVCLSIVADNGCSADDCFEVYVTDGNDDAGNWWDDWWTNWWDLCYAYWNFYPEGLNVEFENLSSDFNVDFYTWDFGDGNTSSEENPTHTYAESGDYEVCLTIETNGDCSDTDCYTIAVEGADTGGGTDECFAFWVNSNEDLTVSFADLSFSTGTIASYNWDFGDMTLSTEQNPIHTYETAGTYLVCLIIETENGCIASDCFNIEVEEVINTNCAAQWNFNPMNLAVQFMDLSDMSNIVSWSWSFGDGNTSMEQNPSHTYATSGLYEVCLTVETADGCTDMSCFAFEVTECFAYWNYEDTDLMVAFENLSSEDAIAFVWNFGDGNTSSEENPTHTYAASGDYEVCLIIETASGCTSDEDCFTISIEGVINTDCIAFWINNNDGLTVSFVELAFVPQNVTSWSWSFGDGNSSIEAAPIYTYAAAGTYNVCLSIETAEGCTATQCYDITVEDVVNTNCAAQWNFNPMNLAVQFMDLSDMSNTVSWSWSFGDGNTSMEQNPSHTYTTSGLYEVCLTVETADGCTDMSCFAFEVIECLAYWNYEDTDLMVAFENLSSEDAIAFVWNFGDGNTSSEENPTHTYAASGDYEVCLIIETASGCTSDEDCFTISIEGVINTDCIAFWINNNDGLTVSFVELAFVPQNVTSWSWSFGDGNSSIEAAPIYTYAAAGTYNVCLSIETAEGCTATQCYDITVEDVVNTNCAAQWNFNPMNLAVQFMDLSDMSNIVSWSWSFGDGNTSMEQNPSHTYATSGLYEVCLTVETADGCTDMSCFAFEVTECFAYWNYENADLMTTFENLSSEDAIAFAWNFGDGNTSSEENPTHTYAASGDYEVCLIIETASGCTSDEDCFTISIEGVINTDCYAYWQYECDGLGTQFNNYSWTSNILNVNWSFGDGNGSTEENPYYEYAETGDYEVCLTIETADGCTDTQCGWIYVEVYTNNGDCEVWWDYYNYDLSVYFESDSWSWFVTSYVWDFGDGSYSSQTDPTHHYDEEGYYEVCLTITDVTGCEATYCEWVEVYQDWGWNSPTVEADTKIVAEKNNSIFDLAVHLYPNPSVDNLQIAVATPTAFSGNIAILNLLGQTVANIPTEMKAGKNTISVDVSAYNKGLYVLQIIDSKEVIYTDKFTKK
ncbi:MAG: PKD domain-containing protein [Chitinophagales bacterium]